MSSCFQVESRSRGVQKPGQAGRSFSKNWTPVADRRRRTAGRKVAQGFPTSRLPNLSTTKSVEQSENVYENKGRGKRIERSSALSGIDPPLTRLATFATLSPGKQADDEVRSGTRSDLRKSKNRGNKPRMSMKTKDNDKKSPCGAVPDRTPAAPRRAAGRKAARDLEGGAPDDTIRLPTSLGGPEQ